MDLMKMGTDLLMSKLGGGDADGDGKADGIMGALSGLLGGADGNLDLAGLASKMNAGGLQDVLGSWLGDGENKPISTDQVRDLFGGDKVAEFASKLNVSEDEAVANLAETVPQMVDKGSSGGSLLDSIGGLGGAMDMAKKLF